MNIQGVIRNVMTLMVVAGTLVLVGCTSSGDSNFQAATEGTLENRNFTFADGAAFGLPDQAVTLTFGNFAGDGDENPNTGPFSLESASGTATGTITVGFCRLVIGTSTFDAVAFPTLQPGRTVLLDPCELSPEDDALRVRNADTDIVSTSNTPTPTTGEVAFLLTTDFSTGSYSIVDVATRHTFGDIDLGGVSSDALARAFGGLIYVVNRGADNVQIIDPQQGFMTVAQESVGNGTNPQDIAFVGENRAYVSRLKSAELLIVDATTLARLGTIDLSDWTQPDDRDHVPEPSRMLVHNGLVYLTLQHLDFSTGFPPERVAPGEVVVINPAVDEVVSVIALKGTDPFSDLQYSPALNRILVSTIGAFGVADGGIEAINPDTNMVDAMFVASETALGGDITHFEVVSDTKGFAIVTDANFAVSLVSFNPSTGAFLNTLVGPLNVFVPHFAINSRGELYLAVADTTTVAPEIIVFDTVQDTELDHVLSGALPAQFVLFFEG